MDAKDYYERFKGKTCKRFPNDVEPSVLKDAHKIKMEMKRIMASRRPPQSKPHIFANISRHHEYYGETPRENELRMRENNS